MAVKLASRFDDWARPGLCAASAWLATPTSIAVHTVFYLGWWATGLAELALAIAMSVEAILLALVIIDKQNIDANRDREWQRAVFTELLDKLPGAEPEIASEG
jgi:hypothetical protein